MADISELSPGEIEALWREATPLSSAWIEIKNPYWRKQAEDGTKPDRANIAMRMMVDDVYRRIAAREWTAIGHRVRPDLSDGPVVVPAHIFDQPVSDMYRVDEIEASGRRFDRVRVVFMATNTAEPTKPDSTIDPSPFREKPVKKGGRPPMHSYIEEVLFDLVTEDQGYSDFSSTRLMPVFEQRFAAKFPSKKYRFSTPSERTLRRYLETRGWPKPDNTGQNEMAN